MIEVNGLTGAEAFLRVLSGMGVERIFASPGSEWSPVWEALAKPDESMPVYLSSRHEEIALAMASGYAKATGKLPGVMIHTTVGALHGSMALRGALHEQVPMVVFTGESLAFGEDDGPDPGGQWMRFLSDVGGPAALVDRCVKWSFGVNDKNILVSTIQRACQMAMASPRGPVFVSLPMEYLFDKVAREAPLKVSMPSMPSPDPCRHRRVGGPAAHRPEPRDRQRGRRQEQRHRRPNGGAGGTPQRPGGGDPQQRLLQLPAHPRAARRLRARRVHGRRRRGLPRRRHPAVAPGVGVRSPRAPRWQRWTRSRCT